MPARRLPLHPDLRQLKHQAKDLLRALRAGDPTALEHLRHYHPDPPPAAEARLADAQLVLARSYEAPSWPRLALACRLIDAIWDDDVDAVRDLIRKHPQLLHEQTTIRDSHWGPPLSYAANAGRNRVVELLRELGADDVEYAFGRAVLQGHIDTARALHRMLARPLPRGGWFAGPAYTLSAEGTAYLFEIGAELLDEHGNPYAPVEVVLESDSRKPAAKHRILELYVEHGYELPDTPMMALHRGRIDLLERHLRRDPGLLTRTFSFAEIFPPEFGCRQPDPGSYDEGLPRTPIAGTTLLHVCVEFDELEVARWLLDQGMDPDARADVDDDGFGGHTALFNAVVCYSNFWMNYAGGWAHTRKPKQAAFAELLLERGADPNARASLREPIDSEGSRTLREHRNVTPVGWGEAFGERLVVSEPALRVVAAGGGVG
jgi:ankyrin repeat protein